MARRAAVVGAGVFGVTTAIELAGRGWAVTLLDPGPLPHPLAASTDISKIIRADYGSDEFYVELVETCFPIWQAWNRRWGTDLYHETGFLLLAGGPMEPGGYEYTSYTTLRKRGHVVEHLGPTDIARRFPAWNPPDGVEGYLSPAAGWAESGAVIERLIGDARAAGVDLRVSAVTGLLHTESRVEGVTIGSGERIDSDVTVVAAGAWTVDLVPGLTDLVTATGQPVIHFRPEYPAHFRLPEFPAWAADIGNTGWYGFPALDNGIVKVANHGPGRAIHPDAERRLGVEWEHHFRSFLSDWIPALSGAPIIGDRLCLYTDTADGDFLIDRHPNLDGLVVATGGSGHGFKFAPILGTVVADTVEGRDNRFADRFRWRAPTAARKEAARSTGPRPGTSR